MKRILPFLLLAFLHENLSAKLPDLIPYRKGNLWGYCDSTKKIIIPVKYDEADPFFGNTAIASYQGKQVIVDRNGYEIFLSDSIAIICREAHYGVRTFRNRHANTYGLMDEKGHVFFEQVNLTLIWASKKYLYGYKGSKMAIYDFQGRLIIDYKYEIPDFVEYNYGYDDENRDNGKFILFDKKGHWGILDTMGNMIVPFIYDGVSYSGCGYYSVLTGDSVFTLDNSGKKIWEAKLPSKKERRAYEKIPVNSELGLKLIPTSPVEKECQKTKVVPIVFYGRAADGHYKVGFIHSAGDTLAGAKLVYDPLFAEQGILEIFEDADQSQGYRKFLGYADIYGTEYWEEEKIKN